ncbi:MAG: tetratricopeptide repeat protein, partial [Actinomycetota bacterium]|nr:tetratricopeptide repeat protein [Actinomycetota bacterium]
AVVRAAAEAGLSRVAWPLAQRLVGFFDRTNRLGDWELACESALLATERAGDVAGRAGMLRLLAAAQRLRGDLAAAQRTATMARDMYAGFDPDRGAAAAGVRLATVHQVRQELDVAAQIAAEALSAARRIGDPILLGNALEVSGSICAYRGESEAALRMLAEALAAYTAGGSEHAIAAMQGGIGLMLKRLGRYSEARAALEEAQQVTDRLGDRSMRAHWDSYLAEVLSVQEHHDEAMQLARAAVQIQRESGDRHSEAVALDVLSEVTLPALGLAAAVPILEEAFRAWRAAGLSPAAALQRLIAACRAAGDEQAAARYAADLQRLAADG